MHKNTKTVKTADSIGAPAMSVLFKIYAFIRWKQFYRNMNVIHILFLLICLPPVTTATEDSLPGKGTLYFQW